jgi:hypothetical protein
MKQLLLIIFVSFWLQASAQDSVFYVTARSGLSIRQSPSVNGKIIGKLNYGDKVIIKENVIDSSVLYIDGFPSGWAKVNAKGLQGYIVDVFLFSIPPPQINTTTIKSYLTQLSKVAAVVNYGDQDKNPEEETYSARTKTLYKNGAEIIEHSGYEWLSTTYVLPKFSLESAFQLLRLIPEFKQLVNSSTAFPAKDKKTTDLTIELTFNKGCTDCIDKISFHSEKDTFEDLDIFEINGEVYIVYQTGD